MPPLTSGLTSNNYCKGGTKMKDIEYEGIAGKFFTNEEFERLTQTILKQNTLIATLRKEVGV